MSKIKELKIKTSKERLRKSKKGRIAHRKTSQDKGFRQRL